MSRTLSTTFLVALFSLTACSASAKEQGANKGAIVHDSRTYKRPATDELKKKLTPMQFKVTQEDATEPPFRNEFWDNHEAGLYVDVTTGEPLFSSVDKFDSGTGWPSFTRPVDAARIIEHKDHKYGMVRVEVRSKAGNAHLGHVFDDGPRPTGMRYCINSASLTFIPVKDLEAKGYGAYLPLFGMAAPAVDKKAEYCAPDSDQMSCATTFETAILAGGCFWGMEDIIRDIPGVVDTDVGYTGGDFKSPTYNDVKMGDTGHAESVRVVFDPKELSYADLLEKWFFRMHDPTTKDRQGNDIGTQYRSAIFYTSDEQKKVAEEVKAKVDKSGFWKKPIVTEIVKAGEFTLAEDYHQDYLERIPNGYTCHFMRTP